MREAPKKPILVLVTMAFLHFVMSPFDSNAGGEGRIGSPQSKRQFRHKNSPPKAVSRGGPRLNSPVIKVRRARIPGATPDVEIKGGTRRQAAAKIS
jgi:hypothetical protein